MGTIINLDCQSRTPIYEQIINEVIRYVSLGIYKPGEQILSIRELAMNLGVNPNTVRKAYLELEQKGVINTISTKGTFISDKVEIVINKRIDDVLDEIQILCYELYKLGLKKGDILKKIK